MGVGLKGQAYRLVPPSETAFACTLPLQQGVQAKVVILAM
jgi:hypothetical protein